MVVLEWAERSDPEHADPVWFGREHPAFMWPPPHVLVDRWPPLWVPHSVRLVNVRSTARTWRFPPHEGRGTLLDPDEPPCRLITIGTDEVESLVLIWSDGSRALHAPRVQCTRRACLARAARTLQALRLRGNRVASVQCTLLHAILRTRTSRSNDVQNVRFAAYNRRQNTNEYVRIRSIGEYDLSGGRLSRGL